MKDVNLSKFILMIFLIRIEFAETIDKSERCDLDLLNSFRLKGLDKNDAIQKPDICPFIGKNCCSLLDQLSIMKYWNNYSVPKINQ